MTFIKLYRVSFPGWANGGYGPHNHGRTPLLVNFHGLDPSFPDEAVSEGPAARAARFIVQRRLFGVGMNTDLTTQDPAVEAYTDWEFTGEAPFFQTVREGVWIGYNAGPPAAAVGHVTGICADSLHGFCHGGIDNETNVLPASHPDSA